MSKTETGFAPKRVILVFPQPSPKGVLWGPHANSAANAYQLTGPERELCERRARTAVGSRHDDIRVALSDVMAVVAHRSAGVPPASSKGRQ
jgi:hypothetical protein